MKKINNSKLKILFIIIIVAISIVFLHFVRNAIIINSLINKASKYENINNYHLVWSTYSNEEITIFDVYYKDEKYKQILTSYNYNRFINDEILPTKTLLYRDETGKEMLYLYNENILNINNTSSENFISPQNMSHIAMIKSSTMQFILTCLNSFITSAECNNVKAYKMSSIIGYSDITYINKETGLTLRSISGYSYENDIERKHLDCVSDIIYEFDAVTDENISAPNTEGFTIKENQ